MQRIRLIMLLYIWKAGVWAVFRCFVGFIAILQVVWVFLDFEVVSNNPWKTKIFFFGNLSFVKVNLVFGFVTTAFGNIGFGSVFKLGMTNVCFNLVDTILLVCPTYTDPQLHGPLCMHQHLREEFDL